MASRKVEYPRVRLHLGPMSRPRLGHEPRLASAVARAVEDPASLSADDVLHLQRTAGNRAVGSMLAGGDMTVQRRIQWDAGGRTRSINLAQNLLADLGVTPARINGHEFPGRGNAQTALHGPQLTVTPGAGASSSVSVSEEPTNAVGYRMELPAAPPWSRRLSKLEAGSAVGMVAPGTFDDVLLPYTRAGGDTVLNVEGLPDSKSFAQLVERHENHHVQEVRDGVNEILRPWDTQIREFKEGGQPVIAARGEDPHAAFYAAVGGTPAQLGQRLVDDFQRRGDEFHRTGPGGRPTVEKVEPGWFRRSLTVHWRHAMG